VTARATCQLRGKKRKREGRTGSILPILGERGKGGEKEKKSGAIKPITVSKKEEGEKRGGRRESEAILDTRTLSRHRKKKKKKKKGEGEEGGGKPKLSIIRTVLKIIFSLRGGGGGE